MGHGNRTPLFVVVGPREAGATMDNIGLGAEIKIGDKITLSFEDQDNLEDNKEVLMLTSHGFGHTETGLTDPRTCSTDEFQTGIFEVCMAFTHGPKKRLRLLHKARAAAEAYGASDLRKKKKEKMVQVGTRKIRKKKRATEAAETSKAGAYVDEDEDFAGDDGEDDDLLAAGTLQASEGPTRRRAPQAKKDWQDDS